jgi:hypothetical protein
MKFFTKHQKKNSFRKLKSPKMGMKSFTSVLISFSLYLFVTAYEHSCIHDQLPKQFNTIPLDLRSGLESQLSPQPMRVHFDTRYIDPATAPVLDSAYTCFQVGQTVTQFEAARNVSSPFKCQQGDILDPFKAAFITKLLVKSKELLASAFDVRSPPSVII